MFSLADINFYSHCGAMVERMFPDLDVANRAPNMVKWRARVTAIPGMAKALAGPDKTDPRLRTFSGHVR
jgi:glutathione S-transferase